MNNIIVNEDLLKKRYLHPGEKTWEDLVQRVSRHAAKDNEKLYKNLCDIIGTGRFFPSRMTYMGTDSPFASSCFVLPVEDNLHDIMETLQEATQVQKFGGGTGYNFSRLRPKGDMISSTGGESGGPVS